MHAYQYLGGLTMPEHKYPRTHAQYAHSAQAKWMLWPKKNPKFTRKFFCFKTFLNEKCSFLIGSNARFFKMKINGVEMMLRKRPIFKKGLRVQYWEFSQKA